VSDDEQRAERELDESRRLLAGMTAAV